VLLAKRGLFLPMLIQCPDSAFRMRMPCSNDPCQGWQDMHSRLGLFDILKSGINILNETKKVQQLRSNYFFSEKL
jgi:hypothetical protein